MKIKFFLIAFLMLCSIQVNSYSKELLQNNSKELSFKFNLAKKKELPRGVTGFFNEKIDLSEIDRILIKKKFYNIENLTNFKLIKLRLSEYPSNYHLGIFQDKNNKLNKFGVVINIYYPFLAGVKAKVNIYDESLNFIDLPKNITSIFSKDFKVLTKKELESTVTKDDLKWLASSELKEIEYWEASSYGSIVFNNFD